MTHTKQIVRVLALYLLSKKRCLKLVLLAVVLLLFAHANAQENGAESAITLKSGSWELVSISTAPASTLILDIFGSALSADDYGSKWIVYAYDGVLGEYVDPGVDGAVSAGEGFWIIHITGSDIFVTVPDFPDLPVIVDEFGCVASDGCYQHKLDTNAGSDTWNITGVLGSRKRLLSELSFSQADSMAACFSQCDVNESIDNGLISENIWVYNSGSNDYERLNGDSVIPLNKGFWLQTTASANDFNLLVSRVIADPDPEDIASVTTQNSIEVNDPSDPRNGMRITTSTSDANFIGSTLRNASVTSGLLPAPTKLLFQAFELKGVSQTSTTANSVSIDIALDKIPDLNEDGSPDFQSLTIYRLKQSVSSISEAVPSDHWDTVAVPISVLVNAENSTANVTFETNGTYHANGSYAIGMLEDDLNATVEIIEIDDALANVLVPQARSAGLTCNPISFEFKVSGLSEVQDLKVFQWRVVRGDEYVCTSINHSQTLEIFGFNNAVRAKWLVGVEGFAAWAFDSISKVGEFGIEPVSWSTHTFQITIVTRLNLPLGAATAGWVNTGLELYVDLGVPRRLALNNLAHEIFHIYQAKIFLLTNNQPLTDTEAMGFGFTTVGDAWLLEGTATWFADEVSDIDLNDSAISVYGAEQRILEPGLWQSNGYGAVGLWKLINNICGGATESVPLFASDIQFLPVFIAELNNRNGVSRGKDSLGLLLGTKGCSVAGLFHEYNKRTQRDGNFSFIESDEDLDTDPLLGSVFNGLEEQAAELVGQLENEQTLMKAYPLDTALLLRAGSAVSIRIPAINTQRTCRNQLSSLSISIQGTNDIVLAVDLPSGSLGTVNGSTFDASLLSLDLSVDNIVTFVNTSALQASTVQLEVKAEIRSRGLVIIREDGSCVFP